MKENSPIKPTLAPQVGDSSSSKFKILNSIGLVNKDSNAQAAEIAYRIVHSFHAAIYGAYFMNMLSAKSLFFPLINSAKLGKSCVKYAIKSRLACALVTLVTSLTCSSALAVSIASEQLNAQSKHANALSKEKLLELTQDLDRLISQSPTEQISASLWDISNQQSVYEHNIHALMQPASVMKLLTAVSAIAQLGPDYRFKTRFVSAQSIKPSSSESISYGARLKPGDFTGNIYLEMSGDPSLSSGELEALIDDLKSQGITQITGRVYLLTDTNEQIRAPGWVWDDLGICYAAPVSRFILDENCIKAKLTLDKNSSMVATANPASPLTSQASLLQNTDFSSSEVNSSAFKNSDFNSQPTTIQINANAGINVTNSAVFMPTNASEQDKKFCHLALTRLGNNQYHLAGCYPSDNSLPLAIAIDNPKDSLKLVLARLLKQAGIGLTNSIEDTFFLPIPSANLKVAILAEHYSAPLITLIDTMLKDSNNLIADSLFKATATDFYGKHSDFIRASQAQQQILTQLGLDISTANLVDGSGLSRYNLLSTSQLMALLQLITTDKQFAILQSALPQAGVSGTLAYKAGFSHPRLKSKVFAKTGTMLGVSNLAGTLTTQKGKAYLFVLTRNGISPHSHEEQDLSVRFLIQLMAKLEE
jgi:D-alanyl-D-alanine carboxypeptidase/D-alanyl-D-alanine-endopeptidase (penicillin-binding protein 4)